MIVVYITNRGFNEMTAVYGPPTIHAKYRFSGMASFSQAGMLPYIVPKKRINPGEGFFLVRMIVIRLSLVRINPQVHFWRKFVPQGFYFGKRFPKAYYPHTVANAQLI